MQRIVPREIKRGGEIYQFADGYWNKNQADERVKAAKSNGFKARIITKRVDRYEGGKLGKATIYYVYVGTQPRHSKRVLRYHGRSGRPLIHIDPKTGKSFVMVRAKGGGTKRLYEGSLYAPEKGGPMKRLLLQ